MDESTCRKYILTARWPEVIFNQNTDRIKTMIMSRGCFPLSAMNQEMLIKTAPSKGIKHPSELRFWQFGLRHNQRFRVSTSLNAIGLVTPCAPLINP